MTSICIESSIVFTKVNTFFILSINIASFSFFSKLVTAFSFFSKVSFYLVFVTSKLSLLYGFKSSDLRMWEFDPCSNNGLSKTDDLCEFGTYPKLYEESLGSSRFGTIERDILWESNAPFLDVYNWLCLLDSMLSNAPILLDFSICFLTTSGIPYTLLSLGLVFSLYWSKSTEEFYRKLIFTSGELTPDYGEPDSSITNDYWAKLRRCDFEMPFKLWYWGDSSPDCSDWFVGRVILEKVLEGSLFSPDLSIVLLF